MWSPRQDLVPWQPPFSGLCRCEPCSLGCLVSSSLLTGRSTEATSVGLLAVRPDVAPCPADSAVCLKSLCSCSGFRECCLHPSSDCHCAVSRGTSLSPVLPSENSAEPCRSSVNVWWERAFRVWDPISD